MRSSFAGIARNALAEKPSSFVPDNDPVKNAFFWKNLPDLARGLPEADVAGLLPFVVDAGPGRRVRRGGPVGGTTVVDIPNSHLQYAITWYGLAAVLSVMLVLLVLRAAPGSARRLIRAIGRLAALDRGGAMPSFPPKPCRAARPPERRTAPCSRPRQSPA